MTRPLRAAIALNSFVFGGMEEHATLLAGALPACGVEPLVISAGLEALTPLDERLTARGIPHVSLDLRAGGLSQIAAATRLARTLRQRHVDLLHVQLVACDGGRVPLLAARLAGIPCIVTHHLAPDGLQPLPLRLSRAPFLSGVSAFIAVSEANRCRQIRGMALDAGRFVTIHNGICLPDDSPTARAAGREWLRAALQVPADTPVVGIIGRLSHQKGHTHLIKALPALAAAVPGVRVAVIGEGELEGALRAEADALGVSGHLAWLGFRDDVPRLLPGMDALAMPSEYEGLPFVLLEAMGNRIPTVAAAVDGIPEAMRNGVEGVLIPRGDVGALTEGLTQVLRDPQRAAQMGEAARERIEEGFTVAAMTCRTAEVYRQAVGKTRKP